MVTLPAHRLANKILAKYNHPKNKTLRMCHERLSDLTLNLKQLTKMFSTAIDRQWLASAVKLKKRIGYITDNIECRAKDIGPDTNEIIAGLKNYPTQSDLIEDLKAVKEEFGDLLYDQEESCLVVYSEDIIFDDVNLGSFELRISINLRDSSATVVARTPNYPIGDEVTTHPHIQDDNMCLGEGRDQFYDAIRQGRVLDAFITLNSILINYNPGSAYVKIKDWDENSDDYINCGDCGYSVEDENICICQHCNLYYCRNCVDGCDVCDDMYCGNCMTEICSICKNKRLCNSCLFNCKTCGEIFCDECINDPEEEKEQNCANCQKDLDEGLSFEIRPECVGQIMLFAG